MDRIICKADGDRRNEMKRLWKETFHDSDEYVNMIFDSFLLSGYSLCCVENDKVVAALVGVPYRFSGFERFVNSDSCFTNSCFLQKQDITNGLQGLYLCGLATRPEFRHNGIMTEMIERVNEMAKADGFDFTFLIPADEGLGMYYRDRGYVNAFYRCVSRFAANHDFLNPANYHKKLDQNRVKDLRFVISDHYDSRMMYKLYDLVIGLEKKPDWLTLSHSVKDIDMVAEDCRMSDGKMCYVYDRNDSLMAVTYVSVNTDGEVVIPHLYYRDEESMCVLLDGVKRTFADRPMLLYSFPEMVKREVLWNPFYEAMDVAASNEDVRAEVNTEVWSAADNSVAYGMLRLLRKENVVKFLNIVKSYQDITNKLQSDSPNNATDLALMSASEGNSEVVKRVVDAVGKLSLQELAEVIFRKESREDLIGEAYGLPRLPMNMAYLLD